MTVNNSPYEHAEQVQFFVMAFHKYPWLVRGKLLFAIPNGGFRNKATAVKLQQEGLVAGVPDMFCAYPKGKYHGLFIEMKRRKGGTVSADQKIAISNLRQVGYRVEIAKGCDEAMSILDRYIKGLMEAEE